MLKKGTKSLVSLVVPATKSDCDDSGTSDNHSSPWEGSPLLKIDLLFCQRSFRIFHNLLLFWLIIPLIIRKCFNILYINKAITYFIDGKKNNTFSCYFLVRPQRQILPTTWYRLVFIAALLSLPQAVSGLLSPGSTPCTLSDTGIYHSPTFQ